MLGVARESQGVARRRARCSVRSSGIGMAGGEPKVRATTHAVANQRMGRQPSESR